MTIRVCIQLFHQIVIKTKFAIYKCIMYQELITPNDIHIWFYADICYKLLIINNR